MSTPTVPPTPSPTTSPVHESTPSPVASPTMSTPSPTASPTYASTRSPAALPTGSTPSPTVSPTHVFQTSSSTESPTRDLTTPSTSSTRRREPSTPCPVPRSVTPPVTPSVQRNPVVSVPQSTSTAPSRSESPLLTDYSHVSADVSTLSLSNTSYSEDSAHIDDNFVSVQSKTKRSNSLPLPSQNDESHDLNPVGLQQIMVYLLKNLDSVSAKCNELQSKVDIMQASLFTSLNGKLDAQIRHFRNTFDVDNLLRQFSIKNETLKTDFESKFRDLETENRELRSVWDRHMENLRDRVLEPDEVASDEEADNSHSSSEEFRDLKFEVDTLKEALHNFDIRLIECESYPRRESLVISGIPSSIPQRQLESKVLEILYYMGFEYMTGDDIAACHRLYNPPGSRYPARVIVRFINRKCVEWCLSHTDRLRDVKYQTGLNLRFFESLSSKNAESLKICKYLSDQGMIHKYFTRNGYVKIIIDENDEPMKVLHPNFLRDRFDNVPDNF